MDWKGWARKIASDFSQHPPGAAKVTCDRLEGV